MKWTNKGTSNQWKQSEIVFEFIDHPGQFVGIYSNDVANYLIQKGTNPIDVTFEVTTDLGCVRGFHEVKIGKLENWNSAWGYGSVGGLGSPWKRKPWCAGA